MNFDSFLIIIINCFTNFYNFFVSVFNLIINNNFIKLILFLILFYLLIDYFGEILGFIRNIFSIKKENIKKNNNKTDIE